MSTQVPENILQAQSGTNTQKSNTATQKRQQQQNQQQFGEQAARAGNANASKNRRQADEASKAAAKRLETQFLVRDGVLAADGTILDPDKYDMWIKDKAYPGMSIQPGEHDGLNDYGENTPNFFVSKEQMDEKNRQKENVNKAYDELHNIADDADDNINKQIEEETGTDDGSGSGGGKDKGEEEKKGGPKRAYSVLDAYHKGMLGPVGSKEAKGAAAYYIIDEISNFIGNLGKDIGNIAATLTGGTADTTKDKSQWSKAVDVMNEEQRELWGEQMGGERGRRANAQVLDNITKSLANQRFDDQNAAIRWARQNLEKYKNDPVLGIFYAGIMNGNADIINAFTNGKAAEFLQDMYNSKK